MTLRGFCGLHGITVGLGAGALCSVVVFGCNTILDNHAADIVTNDEAGAEPLPGSSGGEGSWSGSSGTSGDPTGGGDPSDDGGGGSPDTSNDTGSGCGSDERLCNGACVSRTDPAYGCGAASCAACRTPHADASCSAGKCVIDTCEQGFSDCNTSPADGCETDLSTATNCGVCKTACPATAPHCAAAGASFACTTGCPLTAPLLCGADCVDPLTSTAHCGTCAGACPTVANATVGCSLGTCTFACKTGFHACTAGCAQDTDPAACGPTCLVCPPAPHADPTCTASACALHCAAGFADCNATAADGCETELASDPLNCGICGRSCGIGTCKAGTCQPGVVITPTSASSLERSRALLRLEP